MRVNNTRQLILTTARPLAEIVKNQTINAQLMDEKIKEVEELQKRVLDMRAGPVYFFFFSCKKRIQVRSFAAQRSIRNCENQMDAARAYIDAEKTRKTDLEEKSRTLSGNCAVLGAYLQKNSIIPYNYTYKAYVEQLIREEVDIHFPSAKRRV